MLINKKKALQALLFSSAVSVFGNAQADSPEGEQTQEHKQEANKAHSASVNSSLVYTEEHQRFFQQRHDQKNQPSDEQPLSKDINFFIRGLMQDLVSNLSFVSDKTAVAVSSFVLLDGDYQTSNLLGLQISESLIHEVTKYGIPVIDFKATGDIEVTDSGDFFFSKDLSKLDGDLPILYVLGGTLVEQQGGYLVNARIVDVSSKAVVSSAQALIPADASHAILKHSKRPQANTIKLIGG